MSRASRQREAQRLARQRTIIVAGIGIVVVIVAAALFMGNGGSSGASGPVVEVSMTEYAFAPSPIEVAAGDVRFTVVNDGSIAHDFVLPALGRGTADQRPGTHTTLQLKDLQPGTYDVVCDLPGHRAAGMVTTLIVR